MSKAKTKAAPPVDDGDDWDAPIFPECFSRRELQALREAWRPLAARGAMAFEAIDGLLTGVHIVPNLIRPSDWLDIVLQGAQLSEDELAMALPGLMGFYNHVGTRLQADPKTAGDAYLPEFELPDDDETLSAQAGRDWAHGFLTALRVEGSASGGWIERPEFQQFLAPVVLLARDPKADVDPEQRMPRRKLLLAASLAAGELYDELAAMRMAALRPGTVRAAPTPGRNEPCSCGSGKKYKKCCGLN